jgi:hypothetical protein
MKDWQDEAVIALLLAAGLACYYLDVHEAGLMLIGAAIGAARPRRAR